MVNVPYPERARPDVSGWRSRLAGAGRLMAEPGLAEWDEKVPRAEPSGTVACPGRSRADRAVVKERGERCRAAPASAGGSCPVRCWFLGGVVS